MELEKLGYDPKTESVHIANGQACEWFCAATNLKRSITAVTRAVKQAALEGVLKSLRVNPSRTCNRGLLWQADNCPAILYDLEDRQRKERALRESNSQLEFEDTTSG